MARVKKTVTPAEPNLKIRPALSDEAEENQLIALARACVKQRLIDGTASSQETVHYLKQASAKSKLEMKLLEAQTEMAIAKKEALDSQRRTEELFAEAIKAFKNYSGQDDGEDDEDY